jgi:succinate dehydrogenase/fumarate reductase cytochrome b subunit
MVPPPYLILVKSEPSCTNDLKRVPLLCIFFAVLLFVFVLTVFHHAVGTIWCFSANGPNVVERPPDLCMA